jgi:hypothetical protein
MVELIILHLAGICVQNKIAKQEMSANKRSISKKRKIERKNDEANAKGLLICNLNFTESTNLNCSQ